MSKNPYMPLWIPDYLADTKHLSTEQHGAYLLLLMSMWVHDGSLPRDDAKLSRIVGMSLKRWYRISDDVLGLFITNADTQTISHKRVSKELRKIAVKSEVRQTAGRKGGSAPKKRAPVEGVSRIDSTIPARGRADTPNQLSLLAGAEANASSPPVDNKKDSGASARLNTHTHTHNQNPTDSVLPTSPVGEPGRTLTDRALDSEFPKWYRTYPHKVGRGQAEKAFRKARREGASLDDLIAGVQRYIRDKPADRDWRYPATWLNGKGWMDEPAAQTAPVPHARGSPAGYVDDDNKRRADWDSAWATAIEKDQKKHG